jgi:acyl-CoA thioesterase-1
LRRFILSFGVLVTALMTVLATALAPAQAMAAPRTILVYGDSLSAAYGIAQERGWVALLEARLKSERLDYSVANASISGETTSGGLARMKKVLERTRPAITVIELGANDGLRGLPVTQMRKNLEAMINEAKAVGSRVLLVGIRMPPNYGPDYNRAFDAAYRDLAKEHKTGFVPFFFEGVVQDRTFFQPDNLHPTAAAQPVLLDTVWKALKPMLK